MTSDERQQLEAALEDPALADRHDRIRAVLGKSRPAAPPEVAARQRAQTHQPGEGATQYDPKTDPRGPEESAGLREFGDRLKGLGRGAMAVGSAIRHPIDTASNPAKVRQLFRGVDDMMTLGYGRDIADSIHERMGHGRPLQSVEASDEARYPDERTGGSIIGAVNPFGVTGMSSKAGAGMARKMFSRVPVKGGMAGAGMGAAQGLVGYEVAAPITAGLAAGSEGKRLDAAKEAARDPLALILAGTAGGVGGSGRGKAAKIRDPRTESGRVIRDVQEAGGPGARINKFGEPVSGGIYESPEMQGLSVGRQGTHELAAKSAERVEAANAARLKAARAQYGDTIDEVIAQHGDRPHPTTNSHGALDDMLAENTINGVVADEVAAATIGKVKRMLTTQSGAQQISAGDMVKARKLVRQLANNAADPSENRVYQVVLGAMDEDAAAIDPRIRDMNQRFAKAMEPIEQSNEILFGKTGKKGRDPELSEAQRQTGINRLGRIGDDTQSGTARDPAIQRFAELGPEYDQQVRLMRAKKAQERLRRGEPQTSDAIDKSIKRPVSNRSVAGALFGGVPGWMAGFALDKYAENPLANKVRLGLPASEAVGKLTGSSAVGVDGITRAARDRGRKKRQKEREERGAP